MDMKVFIFASVAIFLLYLMVGVWRSKNHIVDKKLLVLFLSMSFIFTFGLVMKSLDFEGARAFYASTSHIFVACGAVGAGVFFSMLIVGTFRRIRRREAENKKMLK